MPRITSFRTFIRTPLAAAVFAASLAAPVGAVVALGGTQPGGVTTVDPHTATPIPAIALPDFAALARQYGPAVVNITVTENMKTSLRMPPGFGNGGDDSDDGDDDDNGNPGIPPWFRGMPPGAPRGPMHGQGSGFIVSADGTILTNAHVVADAKTVTVKLTDHREFPAKVVGVDTTSDVAVLKIDAKDLPTVKIGDTRRVSVGEWVVAIGAPFGFENSVTQGIVSAKGRTLPDGSYVPFLQTDVAINPGNSGGPLFNLAGEVVGINSQIYSRSGGYMGVSFAIPIDVAMNVSEQLQATGHVARGRLGVTVQPVNGAFAKSFGLEKPEGALISDVDDDSPAAKAGLESGDVILSFNGDAIQDSSELPARVAALKPGQKATIGIWRNRKAKDLTVQVGEMQDRKVASANDQSVPPGKLGLAVRPLDKAEQRESDADGLLVERVAGAAAEAGIQPGDIVLSANGVSVKSVEQLRERVEKADGSVALLIQRDGHRLFVPVDAG